MTFFQFQLSNVYEHCLIVHCIESITFNFIVLNLALLDISLGRLVFPGFVYELLNINETKLSSSAVRTSFA